MSPTAPTVQEKREFASEIKFVLDAPTAERVRAWAREKLVPDPNAGGELGDIYEVTSLYFDTPTLEVFQREGTHRFSKFRVRRYGGGQLFFERKLKAKGNLAKRRLAVTAEDVTRLSTDSTGEDWAGRWFARKISARQLRPLCQISYQRTARVLMTPSGPIRLTLDEKIRALPVNSIRFQDSTSAVTLSDRVVLELKYRRDLPALFRELVAHFALNPQPFSKYRAAIQTLGLAPDSATATLPSEKVAACQTS